MYLRYEPNDTQMSGDQRCRLLTVLKHFTDSKWQRIDGLFTNRMAIQWLHCCRGMGLIGIAISDGSRAGLTCKLIHNIFSSSHMPNEWVSPEWSCANSLPTSFRLQHSNHRSEGWSWAESPPNRCYLSVNYLTCVENTEQDLWAMSERENWR